MKIVSEKNNEEQNPETDFTVLNQTAISFAIVIVVDVVYVIIS